MIDFRITLVNRHLAMEHLHPNSWMDIPKKNIRYYSKLNKFGKKKLLEIAESAQKLPAWTGPGNMKIEIGSYQKTVYLAWTMIYDYVQWTMIDSKEHFEKGMGCSISSLREDLSVPDGQHKHGFEDYEPK
jgi:hypothetical protein